MRNFSMNKHKHDDNSLVFLQGQDEDNDQRNHFKRLKNNSQIFKRTSSIDLENFIEKITNRLDKQIQFLNEQISKLVKLIDKIKTKTLQPLRVIQLFQTDETQHKIRTELLDPVTTKQRKKQIAKIFRLAISSQFSNPIKIHQVCLTQLQKTETDVFKNSKQKLERINNSLQLFFMNDRQLQQRLLAKSEQWGNIIRQHHKGEQIQKLGTLWEWKQKEKEFSEIVCLNIKQRRIKEIPYEFKILTNLIELAMPQNYISKIENLASFTSLRMLLLNDNFISKLENLQYLVNLEKLGLKKNDIRKIENLDKLKNLKLLGLGKNRIQTIQNIDNLKKLEELYLSENQITVIEGLQQMEQLLIIDLSNNKIKTIEGLKNNKKLNKLFLYKNMINQIEQKKNILNMQSLGIKVYLKSQNA